MSTTGSEYATFPCLLAAGHCFDLMGLSERLGEWSTPTYLLSTDVAAFGGVEGQTQEQLRRCGHDLGPHVPPTHMEPSRSRLMLFHTSLEWSQVSSQPGCSPLRQASAGGVTSVVPWPLSVFQGQCAQGGPRVTLTGGMDPSVGLLWGSSRATGSTGCPYRGLWRGCLPFSSCGLLTESLFPMTLTHHWPKKQGQPRPEAPVL